MNSGHSLDENITFVSSHSYLDTQHTNSSQQSPPYLRSTAKQRVLALVNQLLTITHTTGSDGSSYSWLTIPERITSTRQITPSLYVYFFEKICDTELIDKKWPPASLEDHVHNTQTVIDTLSLDILNEDLSHLTGEAICGTVDTKPDLVSVEFLLDILKCVHEWVASRIESFSDLSQSTITNQPPKDVNNQASGVETATITHQVQIDFNASTNQAYSDLEKKLEHTVKLSEQAALSSSQNMNYHEDDTKPIDLDELIQTVNMKFTTNDDTNGNNDDDDHEDVFQKYMREKELEYKQNRSRSNYSLENHHVNDNSASSSESSSSSACSVNDVAISGRELRQDLDLDLVDQVNLDRKHVKFNVTSRSSNSPSRPSLANSSGSPKMSQRRTNQLGPSNEINSIRASLINRQDADSAHIANILHSVYAEDYKDAKSIARCSLNKVKRNSELTNELYLKAYDLVDTRDDAKSHRPRSSLTTRKSTTTSRAKGVLLPTSRSLVNLHVSSARENTSPKDLSSTRSTVTGLEVPTTVDRQFLSKFVIGEDGILKCLLQEFPYLYTSPDTIHYLWQKHAKQIETLAKSQREFEQLLKQGAGVKNVFGNETKKARAEQHLRETFRRQELLMNIMRKELDHVKRVEEMKRKQLVENSMRAQAREQRFQNARVKRYVDEFRLEQRAKMLKQRTSEELIFKGLFDEALKLQRERMLELKKYAREKTAVNTRRQLDQIESIENYYKNKFSMLNEQMREEREANVVRERAQHQILGKLKREVKDKLETEIRDLQDEMCRDKDFLYWRQLDAERVRHDLATASYTAPIPL